MRNCYQTLSTFFLIIAASSLTHARAEQASLNTRIIAPTINQDACALTKKATEPEENWASWSCDLGNHHHLEFDGDDGRMVYRIIDKENDQVKLQTEWGSFGAYYGPITLFGDPSNDNWGVIFLNHGIDLSIEGVRIEDKLACRSSGYAMSLEALLQLLNVPCADKDNQSSNKLTSKILAGYQATSAFTSLSPNLCFSDVPSDEQPEFICPGVLSKIIRIKSFEGQDIAIVGPYDQPTPPLTELSSRKAHLKDWLEEHKYAASITYQGTAEWMVSDLDKNNNIYQSGVVIPFRTRLLKAKKNEATNPSVELYQVHCKSVDDKWELTEIFETRRVALHFAAGEMC